MNREELTDLIEQKYQEWGYELGWSLLYGPFETMWNPRYPIAFFGLNPGGNEYVESSLSSEEGSSYLSERWGKHKKGEAPLQTQVTKMFEKIASCLGSPVQVSDLLNGCLTANFIPFRSADWDVLEHRSDALNFSRKLWSERIQKVPCNLYIAMAIPSFNEIGSLLIESGYRKSGDPVSKEVGWGAVRYQMVSYEKDGGKSLLVRLPHLSRYRIFGRKESEEAINEIASVSAEYLAQT